VQLLLLLLLLLMMMMMMSQSLPSVVSLQSVIR